MRKCNVAGAVALTVMAAAAYGLLVRPWMLRWGAMDDEHERTFPGDELVPEPKLAVTRAITINAAPGEVWPWLLQLGQGRGGFYSYDSLQNLVGLNIHTADRIVPELQHLEVNDFVPFAEQQGVGMVVAHIEPEKALVLFAPDPDSVEAVQSAAQNDPIDFEASWAFMLEPLHDRKTRLIVRFRFDHSSTIPASILTPLFLEPAHFIMERKMLLGIRQRAEALS